MLKNCLIESGPPCIVNIIVIGLVVGCLVDVVAVVGAILGDVFILVHNFICL
jgi:hypothetical protein